MGRPRHHPLPNGEEETTEPLHHLANHGACSPRKVDAHIEALGVDLGAWTVNEVMMSTTVDSRSGRGHWAHKLARALCGRCALREFCLETALELPAVATDGFWGGLNGKELRRERRRRQDKARRRAAALKGRENQERQDRRASGSSAKVG